MTILASKYDQGKYFKADDVSAEIRLRIKDVTEEQVGEARERKLVVWFTNDSRGLVLNRVNNRTIRGAYGDEVDGWIGKIIVLFPATDEFRGKQVKVIRVRIPVPKEAEAPIVQASATADADIPW